MLDPSLDVLHDAQLGGGVNRGLLAADGALLERQRAEGLLGSWWRRLAASWLPGRNSRNHLRPGVCRRHRRGALLNCSISRVDDHGAWLRLHLRDVLLLVVSLLVVGPVVEVLAVVHGAEHVVAEGAVAASCS